MPAYNDWLCGGDQRVAFASIEVRPPGAKLTAKSRHFPFFQREPRAYSGADV